MHAGQPHQRLQEFYRTAEDEQVCEHVKLSRTRRCIGELSFLLAPSVTWLHDH